MSDNSTQELLPEGADATAEQAPSKHANMLSKAKLAAVLALLAGVSWLAISFLSSNGDVNGVFSNTFLDSSAPQVSSDAGEYAGDDPYFEVNTEPNAEIALVEGAANTFSDVAQSVEENIEPILTETIPQIAQEAVGIAQDTLISQDESPNADSVMFPETPALSSLGDADANPPALKMLAEQNNRAQNQLIGLLKCQAALASQKASTAGLADALAQCYGVMHNIGISPAQYKPLLDLSQPDGVPTRHALEAQFKQSAVNALRVTHKSAGVAKNWLDDVIETAKSLVTIRKVGWQDGSDLSAIIGRAEYYMQQEKYEKSLSELAALPVSAQVLFQPYYSAVMQRNSYMQLIQALQQASQTLEAQHAF